MKYPVACSLFLVAAVGCGEVSTKEDPDAGPEPDAPPMEQPVKVRATTIGATGSGNGRPDPAAIAIFSTADGTVVQAGLVNQQGEAETKLPAGSLVQTIQISESTATTRRAYVMNFHGVKPGDVLNAGLGKALPNLEGASSTMTGNFTATANYNHDFWTECGSFFAAATPVTLTLREGCRSDKLDVLAIQTSTLSPPAAPRFVLSSVNFAEGGVFTVPNAWTTMSNFVLTLTNMPEDVTSFAMTRSTVLGAGASAPVASQFASLGDPGAGTVSGSVPYPQGIGKRALVTATLGKTGFASHRFDVLTSEIAGAQGVDVNELSVPWLGPVTSVPAERKLTWTETPAGSGTPDIRVAAASYRYLRDNVTYDIFVYDFAAPTGTEVVFPLLPAAYAEFDPGQQPSAVTPSIGIIAISDQSNLDGYDAARGLGAGMIASPGTTEQFMNQAFRRRTTTAATRLR